MTAIETLQELAKQCKRIPPSNSSVDDLASVGIDPGEFQKAGVVRSAIDGLWRYLNEVLNSSVLAKVADFTSGLAR